MSVWTLGRGRWAVKASRSSPVGGHSDSSAAPVTPHQALLSGHVDSEGSTVGPSECPQPSGVRRYELSMTEPHSGGGQRRQTSAVMPVGNRSSSQDTRSGREETATDREDTERIRRERWRGRDRETQEEMKQEENVQTEQGGPVPRAGGSHLAPSHPSPQPPTPASLPAPVQWALGWLTSPDGQACLPRGPQDDPWSPDLASSCCPGLAPSVRLPQPIPGTLYPSSASLLEPLSMHPLPQCSHHTDGLVLGGPSTVGRQQREREAVSSRERADLFSQARWPSFQPFAGDTQPDHSLEAVAKSSSNEPGA